MKQPNKNVGELLMLGSPASNGGRGLKHAKLAELDKIEAGSPASNGGRGLKPRYGDKSVAPGGVRPPAMAGVD